MLSLGNRVMYNGRKYIIIHIYNSGFIEIKDDKYKFKVELVNLSEIELIN